MLEVLGLIIHAIRPDRSGNSRYLEPFPGDTILKQKPDEKKNPNVFFFLTNLSLLFFFFFDSV